MRARAMWTWCISESRPWIKRSQWRWRVRRSRLTDLVLTNFFVFSVFSGLPSIAFSSTLLSHITTNRRFPSTHDSLVPAVPVSLHCTTTNPLAFAKENMVRLSLSRVPPPSSSLFLPISIARRLRRRRPRPRCGPQSRALPQDNGLQRLQQRHTLAALVRGRGS